MFSNDAAKSRRVLYAPTQQVVYFSNACGFCADDKHSVFVDSVAAWQDDTHNLTKIHYIPTGIEKKKTLAIPTYENSESFTGKNLRLRPVQSYLNQCKQVPTRQKSARVKEQRNFAAVCILHNLKTCSNMWVIVLND